MSLKDGDSSPNSRKWFGKDEDGESVQRRSLRASGKEDAKKVSGDRRSLRASGKEGDVNKSVSEGRNKSIQRKALGASG